MGLGATALVFAGTALLTAGGGGTALEEIGGLKDGEIGTAVGLGTRGGINRCKVPRAMLLKKCPKEPAPPESIKKEILRLFSTTASQAGHYNLHSTSTNVRSSNLVLSVRKKTADIARLTASFKKIDSQWNDGWGHGGETGPDPSKREAESDHCIVLGVVRKKDGWHVVAPKCLPLGPVPKDFKSKAVEWVDEPPAD